jgi:hypothetical protein
MLSSTPKRHTAYGHIVPIALKKSVLGQCYGTG